MDNENTNQPTASAPEKSKKSIYIAIGVIIAVALIAWGLSMLDKPKEVAKNPCAIDIRATVYEHASSSAPLTRSQVARIMFEQFFSVYKNMPDCTGSALADFKLISVGLSEDRVGGFTIPVTFDLKPLDMTKTAWASSSPEAKIEGGWIRGKKGILSITQQNNLYQIVI